ncbi:MAG: type I DNA topoisomerase [Acidobacteria bacterium]|nr:type I DNA topoisomerase [Acidobacteriota bacterium]
MANKNLVIVESPAKAKTINKYLGADYKVMASVGHIKDLPQKELGVDVERAFQPTYIIIPDAKKRNNKKLVSELKEQASAAKAIYLAADPDREGEAICQHLKEELVDTNPEKPVFRVLCNEITKNAILEAFKNPGQIDEHKVDAQQARRILDRLVGYQVSPLLWKKVKRGISAGRVQSVALRLIVEREREIEKFVKTEYWTIGARVEASAPPPFEARLVGGLDTASGKEWTLKTGDFDRDLKPGERHIDAAQEAEEIVTALKGADFLVRTVEKKEKRRNPVPPFITSKLQQEAARKLRFPVRKTMTVAQKLYEGVDLGAEGSVGLITYMRTDSTRVSGGALEEVRSFIPGQYGPEFLPENPNFYRSKKDAQDAHEAIRPTSVFRTPESVARFLSKEELGLYRLIWQRYVASQMKPALFDLTVIDIAAGDYLFRATGSVLKFTGFLAVYEEGRDEKSEDDEDRVGQLPDVREGERLQLLDLLHEQHFTTPPPRYTEATLVKALEENGVGRPSTYAAILGVIQNRAYVEKLEGKFKPSELGKIVNDLLVESFDDLFNVQYTAEMEEKLDEIEAGHVDWVQALHDFYQKFTADLRTADRKMDDVRKGVPSDEKCEVCGSPMLIKIGRYGRFLACTNAECKATRKLAEAVSGNEPGAESAFGDVRCEQCGRPMTVKSGRWGSFLACTGYPECKTTRKIRKDGQLAAVDKILDEACPLCGKPLAEKQGPFGTYIACSTRPACAYIKNETISMACPRNDCKGEIVVRKTRRGKTFYGCSNYPKCDFTAWDKPVSETCPSCGASYLLEKITKREGLVHICQNPDCKYRAPVPESVNA